MDNILKLLGNLRLSKISVVLGILSVASLLLLVACVNEIDRPGSPTPTASPQPSSTPTLTPTVEATPTPSPGLFLDILGPEDGSTILLESVIVYGNTSPGATVTVNGENAVMDGQGEFQVEIVLSPGPNTIQVTAIDTSGDQETKSLEVTSLPLPFFLVVTEPEELSIVSQSAVNLSGRTSPDAIVSVNGISITVDELGFFSVTVLLDEGPNAIEVVATSSKGETLSKVVAIIFRPSS